jgi:hypothetical protein
MRLGTRISTDQDFPRLAVYERSEAGHPVMTIVFKNPEFSTARSLFWWLVVIALMIGVLQMLIFAFARETWPGTVLVIGGYIIVAAYALAQARSPRPVARRIELDFGRDHLTVFKGERAELKRPLAFTDLTVEDHPDAERVRQNRSERGDKGITNKEKQHVLIGWFGAGGNEQVILLQRGEWPNRHSLREVRTAMLWAAERAKAKATTSGEHGGSPDLFPSLD